MQSNKQMDKDSMTHVVHISPLLAATCETLINDKNKVSVRPTPSSSDFVASIDTSSGVTSIGDGTFVKKNISNKTYAVTNNSNVALGNCNINDNDDNVIVSGSIVSCASGDVDDGWMMVDNDDGGVNTISSDGDNNGVSIVRGSSGDDLSDIDFKMYDCGVLSCLALNVCGILSKLKYPDFTNFISQFDIVCISESKLDDLDDISILGYIAFYKNRGKFRRKSGGVLLLITETILDCINVFEEKNICTR